MAFPQVVASGSGNSGANATQHTITLPAHSAGDLVVVLFAVDGAPTTSVGASTGAWTNVFNIAGSGIRGSGWARIVAGSSETLRLDTDASEGAAWTVYVIDAGTFDPATALEHVATVVGTSTSPNADSLSPTWGALDTLWLVWYVWDGNTSHTSYPANYTANQLTSRWANADGVGIATATRERNAASEDPGAATISASVGWRAKTLAIKPLTAVTGSGAPASGPSTVDGAGTSGSTGTGAPAAGAASAAGAGVSGSAGAGAPAAGAAAASGAGVSGSAGSGAPAAGAATAAGAGVSGSAGSGAPAAGAAAAAGAGVSGSTGSGAAASGAASASGTDAVVEPPQTPRNRSMRLPRHSRSIDVAPRRSILVATHRRSIHVPAPR